MEESGLAKDHLNLGKGDAEESDPIEIWLNPAKGSVEEWPSQEPPQFDQGWSKEDACLH